MRASDGTLLGTDPFRVAEFQPGKLVKLTALEQGVLGRTRLWTQSGSEDGEELCRNRRWIWRLGQVDVVELPVTGVRRAAAQRSCNHQRPFGDRQPW
ncbi:MAG: hypothetical protein IPP47_28200 [Bryobacterales bacterium]|nr:hypothetical protein [Bryobacterales bacterium]